MRSSVRAIGTLVALSVTALGAEPPAEKLVLKVSAAQVRPLMYGEPGYVRFRVENPSNRELRVLVGGDNRNALGRPQSFKIRTIDSNGGPVPQPDPGFDFGGLSYARPLPANGHCDFDLFLPDWATFAGPGTYTIEIARKLRVVPATGDPFGPEGETHDVSATATLEIEPADDRRMQERIDALGRVMLDRRHRDAERATKMMVAFDDVRVVPYFVKLSRRPHSTPRFSACDGLEKYDDSDAFAALCAVARTTGRDIRASATTLALANSSADGLRHCAVHSLTRSPHPAAMAEVWRHAEDASYAVRMTVLHAAADHPSSEARKIVLDMTRDPHDAVRNEAQRYANRVEKP